MNYEETHDLFRLGRRDWNKWANELLQQKRQFIEEGLWEDQKDKWEGRAISVFSRENDIKSHTFSYEANFSEFIFPGFVDFSFNDFIEQVDFSDAIFHNYANFNNTIFRSKVLFSRCKFKNNITLSNVNFNNEVNFSGSLINGTLKISETIFNSKTDFTDVEFDCGASFLENKFKDELYFINNKILKAFVFRKCKFYKCIYFDAAIIDRFFGFDKCDFTDILPSFIQAHFFEVPRLDNINLPPLRSVWDFIFTKASFEESPEEILTETAKWRALRRIAELGHDHETKLKCFAGEIDAARDHPNTSWQDKLIGLAYQLFSDFGRSVMRPLYAWAAGILVFAFLFRLCMSNATLEQPLPFTCYNPVMHQATNDKASHIEGLSALSESTSPLTEPFSLSLRNALVVINGGEETNHRIYGCLYGLERYGDTLIPVVPKTVAALSALQKVWSVVMLFLAGLAIRNLLKMH